MRTFTCLLFFFVQEQKKIYFKEKRMEKYIIYPGFWYEISLGVCKKKRKGCEYRWKKKMKKKIDEKENGAYGEVWRKCRYAQRENKSLRYLNHLRSNDSNYKLLSYIHLFNCECSHSLNLFYPFFFWANTLA